MSKCELVDPAQKAKEPAKGKGGAPVTITAFGNKLVVTSEDPPPWRWSRSSCDF